jgi:hypothetical protein
MLHLAPELVDLPLLPAQLPASSEKGARFYEAILATLEKELTREAAVKATATSELAET